MVAGACFADSGTNVMCIDVDEARLKKLLKDNAGEDAGMIIARLIIERQLQKIVTRRASQRPPPT